MKFSCDGGLGVEGLLGTIFWFDVFGVQRSVWDFGSGASGGWLRAVDCLAGTLVARMFLGSVYP